jgi:hypothetical protein
MGINRRKILNQTFKKEHQMGRGRINLAQDEISSGPLGTL